MRNKLINGIGQGKNSCLHDHAVVSVGPVKERVWNSAHRAGRCLAACGKDSIVG